MNGLEERGAMRGLVERGAMRGVGDSEWLEDSGVQGGCPFSHHRICTHICRVHLEGGGAVGPHARGKCARQQLRVSAEAALKNSL